MIFPGVGVLHKLKEESKTIVESAAFQILVITVVIVRVRMNHVMPTGTL